MDEQLSISRKINWRGKTLILIIGIILMAMTLRLPLTVVGPIIEFIREGLGISNVLAGFLTTIPLLAFALVSPFVPRISRTIGIELSLFISMLLLATGIALRSVGMTSLLLVGTIIIGVAISFGNVLLPSFFKLKFPFHVGLMMGIYSVAMNVSGGFGAGLSHPIANTTNWQIALAFPIIIVVIASLVWSPQLRHNDRIQATTTTASKLKLWRSPLAWAVTLAMGLQSFIFYTTGAWLPTIFVSQGMAADKAGWMVAIMLLAQLPLTFIMPVLADKLKNQRPIVIVLTLLYTIGFVGIAIGLTDYTVLWMICIGSAGGSSFSLAMMLFTLRTKTAYAAADLSGFAQSIGYLLAASGPVIFGWLYDQTGNWQLPIYAFLIVVAILFGSGWYAAGNKYVEEQ
ncbi:putative transporter YycB [Metalysinibacillus saudimassiliensis]|uniref:Putative transporter YycB n=1 Tax=Metalysinibacillus saudimassiliensis TaxID=1461583 RepID=A0A078M9G3_9BACL|nr:putative transporter YycB [Metalysinibacillus saudimassiliensis]